jgi:hypothetical protein
MKCRITIRNSIHLHRVLVGKPEGKSHWGDQDVDERMILRWIFRKLEGVLGTG